MHCTLAFILCSITLVSWCDGTYKSALYIKYSINGGLFTAVFPDSKPVTIKYKKGDIVELICSITDKTIHNSKEPYLSWFDDDHGFKSTPSQIYQINRTKVLEDSDDQTNLVCKAESKELKETWKIITNFVRIKSPEEVLKAKFANRSFFILLISILALILVPIAFLLIYAAIRKCMKKRTNACTDETPLDNQTVVYSEILKNGKSNDPPPKRDDPLYTKIRVENMSGVHNPSYVKFDRPDSCVTDNHARNDNQTQIGIDNDYVNGSDTSSGNRKYSSDC